MPSLPSSSVPTATACPLRTLRGSVATRSPTPWRTITQSMRGSRGRDHTPAALTYVGRLVVEKKPSGRTPSAGAGSNRASGAPLSGDASKLGGRYWNRGRVVTGKKPKCERRHEKGVTERRRGTTSTIPRDDSP